MTTTVISAAPTRGGYGGVLRSEWTKIRSVRSTYWSLAAAIFFSVGFAALTSAITAHHYEKYSGAELHRQVVQDSFDAVAQSLSGVALGQLALGVLGALVISSEYRNRMIRTTLTAVPRRGRIMLAKLAVFGAVAVLVGEIITFLSFFIGMAFYKGPGLNVALSDPGVLRAIVATGLYMALAGVMGLGLGLVIRHGAGAITAIIGFLLVVPALASALPNPWDDRIGKMLPLQIGQQAATTTQLHDFLNPWVGLLVLAIYAAVAVAVGGWLLRTRDA